MYEAPINLLHREMIREANKYMDERIFEAIYKCDIQVDRDELLKALSYDRLQYEQGYEDGKADALKWISVKDRLPETRHTMLVCTRNRNNVPKVAMAYYENGFGWCGSGGRWNNVTHWMPMPEPPKEDSE